MKTWRLFFFCLGISSPLLGQKIELNKAIQEGDSVVIYYDLVDSFPGQKYSVDLSRIENEQIIPLHEITGAYGDNIIPGHDKKIIWYAKKEINGFKGDIEFEISATLTYSPLRNLKIEDHKSVKKRKTYWVSWDGGISGMPFNLELIRKGNPVISLNGRQDEHKIKFTVPRSIKTGKGYMLTLLDAAHPENKTNSGNFTVRHRSPLFLKFMEVTLLGAAVTYYFITNKSGGANPGNQPGIDNLPAAPGRPGN